MTTTKQTANLILHHLELALTSHWRLRVAWNEMEEEERGMMRHLWGQAIEREIDYAKREERGEVSALF